MHYFQKDMCFLLCFVQIDNIIPEQEFCYVETLNSLGLIQLQNILLNSVAQIIIKNGFVQ